MRERDERAACELPAPSVARVVGCGVYFRVCHSRVGSSAWWARGGLCAVVGDANVHWRTPGVSRTLVVASVVYTELLYALEACDDPGADRDRRCACVEC